MSENTFSQPYPAINSHVLKLLPVKTVLNVILLRSVLDALSIRARLKLKTDRPRSTQIYCSFFPFDGERRWKEGRKEGRKEAK